MAIPQDGSQPTQPPVAPGPSTQPVDQLPSSWAGLQGFVSGQQATGATGSTTAPGDPWYCSDMSHLWQLKNGGLMGSTKDPVLKIEDVMWRLFQWDQKKLDQMARRLGLPEGSSAYGVWSKLEPYVVSAAMQYKSDPTKAPTLDTVLAGAVKGGVFSSGSPGANMPATQRHESVNLTDPRTAHLLADQILKEKLGRAATSAEKAGFLAALNEAQEASPTVTVQSDLDRETGRYGKTVTSGGVNAQSFADEWVSGNASREKEGRAYQLAGYFEDFVQGLGAVGGA